MQKYLKKKKYIKKCPNIIVDFPSKRKSQYMPTVPINKRNLCACPNCTDGSRSASKKEFRFLTGEDDCRSQYTF
jgi:hypothetical protein